MAWLTAELLIEYFSEGFDVTRLGGFVKVLQMPYIHFKPLVYVSYSYIICDFY